jgi:hypothetical protein
LCDGVPEPFAEIRRESTQAPRAIKSAVNYFGEVGALDLVRRDAD